MTDIPAGSVKCILCRGLVIYKEGDKSRFFAHLQNEHGAFFDYDFLLASSLMDDYEKAEIVKKLEKPVDVCTDSVTEAFLQLMLGPKVEKKGSLLV